MDQSHLDNLYFIDDEIYNCPFCKRNNVAYTVPYCNQFDWDNTTTCFVYFVKCGSRGCGKTSMHLSKNNLLGNQPPDYFGNYKFQNKEEIDNKLFYSQPTSYFTVDERIPNKIRALINEAENCRKSGYLVGSSACLRKAIYEFLEDSTNIVETQTNSRHTNYQEGIKKLKKKFPTVPPENFDLLCQIQKMASNNVHESSSEAWDSKKIKYIVELTKSILHEIYVVPKQRTERLTKLEEMKSELDASNNPTAKPADEQ